MEIIGDYISIQSDGWFREDALTSNYVEAMSGGWWEYSAGNAYFVSASGSDTLPYDTPVKAATNLYTLSLISGSMYPDDTIEVVDDGIIVEPPGAYYTIAAGTKIRSWSGNTSKPTIQIYKSSAFFHSGSVENVKFIKNAEQAMPGPIVTSFVMEMGVIDDNKINNCEFKISNPPSWKSKVSGVTKNLYGSVIGPPFIFVGQGGTILSSSDSVTWVSETSGTTEDLYSGVLDYNTGNVIIVGANGTILTSLDRVNWTPQTSGTSENLRGVCFDGATLVAVGDNGTVLTSSDSVNWYPQTSGVPYDLYGVGFTYTQFVAVGIGGTVLISLDSVTWIQTYSGVSSTLRSIKEPSIDKTVVVGDNGTIIVSSDYGTTWTVASSGVTEDLYCVTQMYNRYLAVGTNGTILFSDLYSDNWIKRFNLTEDLYTANSDIFGFNILVAVGGVSGTIYTRLSPQSFINTPAVYLNSDNGLITNNLFVNCENPIYLNDGTGCVIAHNTAVNIGTIIYANTGLYVNNPNNGLLGTVILNNIFHAFEDSIDTVGVNIQGYNLVQNYNCLHNFKEDYRGSAISGSHNIDSTRTPGNTDPKFINTALDKYGLHPSSPCNNSGVGRLTYPSLPSTDINGYTRSDSAPDMGAYEMVPSSSGNRYWVSLMDDYWFDSTNWSLTSGGPGGASIPVEINTAIFDSSGSCSLDADVSVGGLSLFSDYTSTVQQNNYGLSIGNAFFDGGRFVGEGTNITVTGNLYIGDTTFTSTDATLSCDGTFFTDMPGNFITNNGVVSLNSPGCVLNTPDMTMATLQLNTIARIDASCSTRNIVLKSGAVRGGTSDATVHIFGNIYGESGYNLWSSYNNIPLQLDSTVKQTLYNESGCVLPSLIIDKKTTAQVVCDGRGPIYINRDFIIRDGTFNSNGLDIQVGI